MQHPFDALKTDYASWIDAAVIRPEREEELDHVCRKALMGQIQQLGAQIDAKDARIKELESKYEPKPSPPTMDTTKKSGKD